MADVSVIGAGSWGIALALVLAKNGNKVTVWSIVQEEIDMLNEKREHVDKLPGVPLPSDMVFTTDLEEAVKGKKVLVLAVPSVFTRGTANKMKEFVEDGQIIVNVAKGIEESTLMTLSQVYKEEIPQAKIAVMSGPSHAEEVSLGLPTTNVVAAEDTETAEYIQEIFMNQTFRVYTSTDRLGVELGGALKNVIALCSGISDGMGYGDNTRAALITRGLAEITRLGVKMGAKAETFSGLSGIGDLIVTCTSVHSRNHRAGILLGKGKTLSETLDEVKMVVEGVNTVKAAYLLSKQYDVHMPIITEAYNVVFGGKKPHNAVNELMARGKTAE